MLLLVAVSACTADDSTPEYLSSEELADPRNCETCHPTHYQQWSGSMHAYASTDPVFVALNQRGQRETGGALGDFCVRCHAPMATRLGLTTDGSNLAELPEWARGITCVFCHTTQNVEQVHDVGQELASDNLMRGGLSDPIQNDGHGSVYSELHDRTVPESSALCGGCHDIRTPGGLHLERTHEEWAASVFSPGHATALSCGRCHMNGSDGYAADVEGAPVRRVHDHSMPGVDIALTEFPEREAQRERVETELNDVLQARLCVQPAAGGVNAVIRIENIGAGHSFPSGAAHNRRAWVEVIAYSGDTVLMSSGAVADDEAVLDQVDPLLWIFRDELFDADGNPTHFSWEAASFEDTLLTAAVTNDPTDPAYYHYQERTYLVTGAPDRITMRVRMQPNGLELLDELIESGDLSADVKAAMPTFTLSHTELEWAGAVGDCVTY